VFCNITYGYKSKDIIVVDVSCRNISIQSDRIAFVRIVEESKAIARTRNKLISVPEVTFFSRLNFSSTMIK